MAHFKAPVSRDSVKDPPAPVPAARRSTTRSASEVVTVQVAGCPTVAAVPKDSVVKKKLQSPGEQATGRTPRDLASPSGGTPLSTSQPLSGQASPVALQVQQRGSPQRNRRSPMQDEEPPLLPTAVLNSVAASTDRGAGSPGTSGGTGSCGFAAAAAVVSTSPRGEASCSASGAGSKVKELESRLPQTAKVRELESLLSASTKAQVREVEARLPASSKAQPPGVRLQTTSSGGKASPPHVPPPGLGSPHMRSPPPGLAWPGPPPGLPGLDAVEHTAHSPSRGASPAEHSGGTDSFDEEVELLRCQADLVEAAADIGTTSADDDFLTTDPELDDDDDGMSALPYRPTRRGQFGPSVVIEEDEEGISDDGLGAGGEMEMDGSAMRSRLWAQSLLRLKRSIDEIYSLCEFESDEIMCEQVREILMTASGDFVSLVNTFDVQQEYALLPSELPLKTGVAWTTRTPKATVAKSGTSPLERLERAQSPSSASGRTAKPSAKRRSSSRDPQGNSLLVEQVHDEGGGTGEAVGREAEFMRDSSLDVNREDQLQSMVQSALQRIQTRLGRPSKLSPEELAKRSEEKHRRAQQLRAEQEEQRMHQLRQLGNRTSVARERRQQKEQQMQDELLAKMTRARRQYQDQLRNICERARNENRKAAEVAYISKEELKSEKEIMKQKQENARLARALLREEMRKKLIQSANRVAKVSENKRRQQEVWQQKVLLDMEEKDRLASQRRKQHIHSIRLKSQEQESKSETVRQKARDTQEEDERRNLQQQQDFVHLRSKNIGRLALNVEGLPDGVREEVSEQLQAAVTHVPAGRGHTAPGKSQAMGRCTTPPRRPQSESLKSSPKSDIHDFDDDFDEDAEPRAAQQKSRYHVTQKKLRKARAKPRPAAKAAAAGYAGDSENMLLVDDGGPSASNLNLSPDTSDGNDDEAFSDQEGSEAGDATALGDGGDGDLADMVEIVPTALVCDGSSATKKASLTLKDSRQRRSTSPLAAAEAAESDQPCGQEMYLATLRKQLLAEALSDEEALKVVVQSDGSRTAAVNAAHRARISKLATDLGRVIPLLGNTLGIACSAVTEDSSSQQLGAHSLDLERADAVLSEFCKVLDQSQREADYELVLQLGCVGKVMDICSRIKDSMAMQSSAAERNMSPAMKQLSSVMLSALKWLGLLSKQKISRVFLLLTNRVVLLADVAVACLATMNLLETQSMQSLFLPQVLHVLSLHVKQTLPDSAACFRQKLISYLLVCGLSEKLRDLFKGAGLRGMRLFDGASPVPLLLLRSMCFLGTLVNAYRLPAEASIELTVAASGEAPSSAPVLQMLSRTDLFGIVSVLGTILTPDKAKAPGSQAAERAKLPQTVTSLAVQAVRILNQVARIHLGTLQETLGAYQQEFYHLLVCILDYCAVYQGPKPGQSQGQDESELLHESVVLLGNYCLLHQERQALMCYGEGHNLLTKITSLPLYYFMDEKGKLLLFPTILATCFQSEQNLELLRNEMNLSLLRNFLTALLEQKEEGRLTEAAVNGFGGRFPEALWPQAREFFSDEATPPASQPASGAV